MNYSNSQRAGVILYLAASLFGGYGIYVYYQKSGRYYPIEILQRENALIKDTVSDKGDGKMAEDIKISKLNSGDKLYHYTSAEGLMGISNGEIWITEKSFLNDSTEFRIANEVLARRSQP